MDDGLVRDVGDGRRLIAFGHMANGGIGEQHLIKNNVRPRGSRTEIDSFGGQTGAIGNGGVGQDRFDAIGGDKELERAIIPTAFGPFEPDVIGGVGGDFGGASGINRAVSDLFRLRSLRPLTSVCFYFLISNFYFLLSSLNLRLCQNQCTRSMIAIKK